MSTIRGIVGQVKWTYFTAAAINGYTVTRDEAGDWRLAGEVVLSDAYLLKQRPLVFVAPLKSGAWRWPIEALEFAGTGRLVARLGAPLP